jgi:glycine betaine/proline transport system substrate-binding protein
LHVGLSNVYLNTDPEFRTVLINFTKQDEHQIRHISINGDHVAALKGSASAESLTPFFSKHMAALRAMRSAGSITTKKTKVKTMKKLKAIALAVMATGSLAAQADCGEVSLGKMGWASGEALAEIAKFVMEQGYGCSVTLVPTDTVPAVTSLAENGSPDVVPEVWTNGTPVYAELVEAGRVITASPVFANGGEEGWWVPTYLVEKHPEVATIEGILANPELVGGRFHNCPVGWGCRVVNDALSVVHGLEGNGIEVFNHGSGANLAASIAAAFEDQEAWFGYYWGPTAVLGKYEMTKVDIGPADLEVHKRNADPEGDASTWGVSDYPASPVANAMTTTFADREPEVAEFVTKMTIPNNIVSAMLAWKDENGASAEETAAWFITNHTNLLMDMLSPEAAAKIKALL